MNSAWFPAAVIWMSLIFFASSFPASATGPNTGTWVCVLKTLHFTNFGVLALLLLAVFKGNRKTADAGAPVFVTSLLLTIAYALSDEYHQQFSAGRHPSLRDVLIDTAGACVFLATVFAAGRKRARSKKITVRRKNEK